MSAEAAPNLGLRVLHPTDFSEASEVAFVHALELTLARQGRLHVLQVASRADQCGGEASLGCARPWNGGACFRPEAHPRRSAISGSRSGRWRPSTTIRSSPRTTSCNGTRLS